MGISPSLINLHLFFTNSQIHIYYRFDLLVHFPRRNNKTIFLTPELITKFEKKKERL